MKCKNIFVTQNAQHLKTDFVALSPRRIRHRKYDRMRPPRDGSQMLPQNSDCMQKVLVISFFSLYLLLPCAARSSSRILDSSSDLACAASATSALLFLSSSAATTHTIVNWLAKGTTNCSQALNLTKTNENILGLSLFEYSFNFVTNWSNSFSRLSRFSRLRFLSSGLKRSKSSSSLGRT